jgi:DNA-binding MarR family transcriptional regulator
MIMIHLYVIESADFVFLMRRTGLTWGNLSTHLKKLESAKYVAIEKGFRGKRPHTMVRLTKKGRKAFRNYRGEMQKLLEGLPD